MPLENNDVFISYRRNAAQFVALAVWQDLHSNGINAFYDMESINAGQFDSIILNQIAARPYFMPILTPGTLNRCLNEGDWVRREIEYAVKLKRILVPLRTLEFDFADLDKFLPAAVAAEVKRFNMMELPPKFFKFALQKVREDFLKPVHLPTIPPPADEVKAVERKLAALVAQPSVTEKQLSAEEYFAQALALQNKGDNDGAIADYTEAIRLNPQDANAYFNRGRARLTKRDYNGAITDFTEAIRLNPQFADAYNSRGIARTNKGDDNGAIADFNAAIRLDPQLTLAYKQRGTIHLSRRDYDAAIADYGEAIRLNPQDANAFYNRGIARQSNGDKQGAGQDFDEARRLRGQ